MIAHALFFFINCIYVYLLICCVRPLMYLLPKPFTTPLIPNMAVYWVLLLMDCARDVKNTRCLTHEGNRLRENSNKAKVWKQSQRPAGCGGSTERLGTRSLSLGERDAQQRLGHCGLSSPRGKRLLKQLWCFKVADSLSSANCCFKAVLLRRLSNTPPPPTPHLDWKDPAVH